MKLSIEMDPADIEAIGKAAGDISAAKGAGWVPLLESMIASAKELLLRKEQMMFEERARERQRQEDRLRSVPFSGTVVPSPNGSGPKAV